MRDTPALGPARTVDTSHGAIVVRETGEGPPIVFVHGLLVNGDLWRKVVPRLASRFRCVVPDLPLGSHEIAMRPGADLTPPGLARLIDSLLERLGLDDVTLAGNDTGGALCQITATEHPERIGRLVLTSSDAYENFPPPLFRPLALAASVSPLLALIARSMRISALRRLPVAYGWLAKHGLDDAVVDGWVRPAAADAAIRRDVGAVLRGIDPRYTQEAARKLASFEKPVLLAWSREDRFFPPEHAERLARTIPRARLEWIDDAWTFSAEDQPERLATLIADFAARRVAAVG